MDARDSRPGDAASTRKWYRLGLWIAVGNLVFIGLILVLLEYDPTLAIAFAVTVSILAGIGITVYALRWR